MINRSALLILVFSFVTAGLAQNAMPATANVPSMDSAPSQPKSLADVARASKKDKKEATAKIVLTEDAADAAKGPIPDSFVDGCDNTDDILKALQEYSASHKPKEVEDVLRAWYDKNNTIMSNAIAENQRIAQSQGDRQYSYYTTEGQPRSQQESYDKAHLQSISARQDQKRLLENNVLTKHIQQSFIRVRYQLSVKGSKYDWFKIRCLWGTGCSY
jgi:hypothetical protein